MQVVTLLSIFLAAAATSTPAKIGFFVIDRAKNTTISGVSCSIYDIKGNILLNKTASSQSGRCDISTNFAGFYKLRLSHPNYFVYDVTYETDKIGVLPKQIDLVPRQAIICFFVIII